MMYKKCGVGIDWGNLSGIVNEVNYAASLGADCYDLFVNRDIVNSIRSGTMPDQIAAGISAAHQHSMKFKIRFAEYKYAGSGGLDQWPLFVTTPAYQQAFLVDFEWILSRYPTLDSIEIEESEGVNTTDLALQQTWRSFKNQFLQTEKNMVLKYHPDLTKFGWGINIGNSWMSEQFKIGYDFAFIKENHLIGFINAQIDTPTLAGYITRYSEIENMFAGSGIDIGAFQYVYSYQWGTLGCNTNNQQVGCYTQPLFDILKYVISRGGATNVFMLSQLWPSASWWPNDTTPGATAAEKLKNVWAAITPPPPPAPVLGSIQFPVASYSLQAGDVNGFGTTCYDTSNTKMTCPILTDARSSNTSVAIALIVNNAIEVHAISPGTAQVWIVSGSVTSAMLNITVTPAPCVSSGIYICEQPLNGWKVDNCGNRVQDPACNPLPVLSTINLTPALASIIVGQELVIKAQAFDTNNLPMSGVPIVWSEPSNKLSIIPVNTSTFTDGTVSTTIKGLVVGTVQLQATSSNVVATAIVDINYSNPTSPCGVIGDVDMDGNITQADVDLAKSLIGSPNLTVDQIKRIDVNGNGLADTQDIQLLQDFVDGKITTFPACKTVSFSLGDIAPIALLAAAVLALFSKKR